MTKKDSKKIIQERLLKLEEAVTTLDNLAKINLVDFKKDKKSQYAAMYGLILGIEAICDIGSHILSYHFKQKISSYKDTILQLGEHKIISKSFAKKSSKMIDFRNLLIHVYTKVDVEEVFTALQQAPDEFRLFSKYFLKFLKKL